MVAIRVMPFTLLLHRYRFRLSSAPGTPGFGPEQMALTFAALMERLGYERYALAGGDWGQSLIAISQTIIPSA